jgi:hypothetical protein
MNDIYEAQKANEGKIATFTWLVACAVWIWFYDSAVFISWQAAGLLVVGMFVSAVVFGIGTYGIQRLVGKKIMKQLKSDGITAEQAMVGNTKIPQQIKAIGMFIRTVEVVVIFAVVYFVVDYAFN